MIAGLGIAGGLAYFEPALPAVAKAPELKVEVAPGRLKRGQYLASTCAPAPTATRI